VKAYALIFFGREGVFEFFSQQLGGRRRHIGDSSLVDRGSNSYLVSGISYLARWILKDRLIRFLGAGGGVRRAPVR
jgi:hypothetical protein